jgi:predicted ATPase
LNDPISVAYASIIAVTAYQIIGDRSAVSHVARRMIELAEKFNLPSQLSVATFMSGWASASGNNSNSGRQIMELEFDRVSALGPIPLYYTGLMAGVWLEEGQFERAIGPLDAILNTVNEPGVGFFLPEIHRLRAECLLQFDPPNCDGAVREFQMAIAAAKQQQSRAFELRAALGLAGAWAAQGRPESGIQPLQEIVGALNNDDGPTELATARLVLSDCVLLRTGDCPMKSPTASPAIGSP